MDVSSSTPIDQGSLQVDALKKSMDVAEQSALKVIQSATEQSQQVSAQKSGIGSNLNIVG